MNPKGLFGIVLELRSLLVHSFGVPGFSSSQMHGKRPRRGALGSCLSRSHVLLYNHKK